MYVERVKRLRVEEKYGNSYKVFEKCEQQGIKLLRLLRENGSKNSNLPYPLYYWRNINIMYCVVSFEGGN